MLGSHSRSCELELRGKKGESSAGETGRRSEVTRCQKFTGELTYLEDGNGLK